jgi:hypothetical protein
MVVLEIFFAMDCGQPVMDVKFFGEGGGGFAMGLRKFRDWF